MTASGMIMDDRVTTFDRTQEAAQWAVGLLSLFAIVMFSVAIAAMRSEDASDWLGIFLIFWSALIYLVVLNVTRLRVVVTPSIVELTWRLGWPTKTIDRSSIVSAKYHRNAWWIGWGIRKVARGWMWNVRGLDSVQLELDDSRVFRIGTDDPTALLAALSR